MHNVLVFLNVVLVFYSWRLSKLAFESGDNKFGWVYLTISAMNAAAAAVML